MINQLFTAKIKGIKRYEWPRILGGRGSEAAKPAKQAETVNIRGGRKNNKPSQKYLKTSLNQDYILCKSK
jgi:hypothetical protein